MALIHNNLQNYYGSVFSLAQHHKYSISEIESMIPFERDVYMHMLVQYLKEVEEARNKL
jgi:hypothetical protein